MKRVDDLDRLTPTASKPVEFPEDERIIFTGKINRRLQTGAGLLAPQATP